METFQRLPSTFLYLFFLSLFPETKVSVKNLEQMITTPTDDKIASSNTKNRGSSPGRLGINKNQCKGDYSGW
jgi:hypothetical protein